MSSVVMSLSLSFVRENWVGIHGCRNCIYDRKIYDSVVDLLMKLAQFWYFGHVSKSLVAKSTTAVNPNPEGKNDECISWHFVSEWGGRCKKFTSSVHMCCVIWITHKSQKMDHIFRHIVNQYCESDSFPSKTRAIQPPIMTQVSNLFCCGQSRSCSLSQGERPINAMPVLSDWDCLIRWYH